MYRDCRGDLAVEMHDGAVGFKLGTVELRGRMDGMFERDPFDVALPNWCSQKHASARKIRDIPAPSLLAEVGSLALYPPIE